ncbi:hypothetical protein Pan216_23730 [Planctomycetes bacterium Pan216]|uniref:Uncharacterized protein n=1 Tax=Kolteria novifilia TaxID=2527975 RepID=A0A518B3J8_9BACT|nr:hypothetical protein Pan216_23730 [Planctomycetes bacterium Pan216]
MVTITAGQRVRVRLADEAIRWMLGTVLTWTAFRLFQPNEPWRTFRAACAPVELDDGRVILAAIDYVQPVMASGEA